MVLVQGCGVSWFSALWTAVYSDFHLEQGEAAANERA